MLSLTMGMALMQPHAASGIARRGDWAREGGDIVKQEIDARALFLLACRLCLHSNLFRIILHLHIPRNGLAIAVDLVAPSQYSCFSDILLTI